MPARPSSKHSAITRLRAAPGDGSRKAAAVMAVEITVAPGGCGGGANGERTSKAGVVTWAPAILLVVAAMALSRRRPPLVT